ncbi:MAG: exopolyphosphatase, partial [Pseudomonadota bacterium]
MQGSANRAFEASALPSATDPCLIGVIDVGSNSVRIVVYDGRARTPTYYFDEKVQCGLGKNLAETGTLHPDGAVRARRALRRFVALGREMRLSRLVGVATAAVREAADGPAFCADVLAETGLALRRISGAEEAALAAEGVRLGDPSARGLVCDLGGASMELAALTSAGIRACGTAPIGPLRMGTLQTEGAVLDAIDAGLDALTRAVPPGAETLILVGGSWRGIAKLDMRRRNHPLRLVHGYAAPAAELAETCAWIAVQNSIDLSAQTDTSPARLELLPLAARVLPRLLDRYAPRRIEMSAYGLREGVLVREMPPALVARDPLLEAARGMERAGGRNPGYGDAVFAWLLPLIGACEARRRRLIHAACLLHDIGWRSPPDARAELCYDLILKANLTALDHRERVFLAVTAVHRHKASALARLPSEVLALLCEADLAQAAWLGRALR